MDTEEPVIAPFLVLIDTREQAPFSFRGFRTDARQGHRPLVVPIALAALPSGDYSLEGCEERITIERKSAADAYQTFCHERTRFERELERLSDLEFAAVVIESPWSRLLFDPPPHTQFSPKSFFRSVIAWQVRFPRVQWWACETRTFAERVTLRLLERFHRDRTARGEGRQVE